jgi:signal peptidase II
MRPLLLTTLGVFLLDQASKVLVVQVLGLGQAYEIDVLPPYLRFRMAWNEGINFGLLSGSPQAMRWVLIGLALAISAWVWAWARRERKSRLMQVSAGFLIGGALGNVVDRLIYGAVADFLNMSLPFFDNPYSFNIADIAIFAGAFGLVIFSGRDTSGDKTP